MTEDMKTQTPFFRVQGVTKQFAGTAVLRGIDLTLEPGEILALVGPSGAGKTTFIRTLDFLETADAGTMTFRGKTYSLTRESVANVRTFRLQTAFVFQGYNLFLNKTARENITEGLRFGHGMSREEAEARADTLLARIGLAEHAGKYPSELSGGQQQRVAIARAVAGDPALIFLDEPTSALDPGHRHELSLLLRAISAEGRAMIIVTHDLPFAAEVADRVALLTDGTVVETAAAADFFSPGYVPVDSRTAAFIGQFRHR